VPLAACAFLLAGPAAAADRTGQIAVSVSVEGSCAVAGGSLDFGAYTSGQAEALTGTGTITLTGCTQQVSIALDGGQSASTAARVMRSSGGGSLNYQLYRNSGRSKRWGTGANALVVAPSGSGPQTVDVYGRIAANQTARAGSYSDVVRVTMTF
jgi:spore coat protein U-like protein